MSQINADNASLGNIQVGLQLFLTDNHSQETNLVLEAYVPNRASSTAAMNAASPAALLQVEQGDNNFGPPVPMTMLAISLQDLRSISYEKFNLKMAQKGEQSCGLYPSFSTRG